MTININIIVHSILHLNAPCLWCRMEGVKQSNSHRWKQSPVALSPASQSRLTMSVREACTGWDELFIFSILLPDNSKPLKIYYLKTLSAVNSISKSHLSSCL